MATIRRLYIYMVCFISLQSVVGAGSALVGGVIRWLTDTNPPDTFSFTFQLAVVIVGGPIFIGHWLWARYLARKDLAELNATLRAVYLYATKGVLVFYITISVIVGLDALVAAILPFTSVDVRSLSELVSLGLHCAVVTVVTAGLWFYHERLTADSKLSPDEWSRIIHHLYLLSFSGLGLIIGVIGLAGLLIWVFHRLDQKTDISLSWMIGLFVVGGLAWLYHEWARARAVKMKDSTADVVRWLYATAVSGTAVIMAGIGLAGSQIWLFHLLAGERSPRLPDWGAIFVVSLLPLVYHELAQRRVLKDNVQPLRWAYGLFTSLMGMLTAIGGLIVALDWLFSAVGGLRPGVADGAAWFLPGLIIWGYHHWVMQRSGNVLGLAENSRTGLRSNCWLVRRLYILGFSGLGVMLTAIGLIAVAEWVFARFTGEGIFQLAGGLAWLVVGALVWLYYWRWAGRLFASGHPDETKSDLRKAYLYSIIYITVNTAIITITVLVNGTLRAILGLPTSGSLGLPLSIITASVALWAYHALVLRNDISRAGESALQAGMQRLYWYLVAGLGLAAFLSGLAGELSVILRWLALAFKADTLLKEQFAGFTAALVAGLPVWLSAWVPAQWAAIQTGPVATASRRSILRKLYLYCYALTAVLVALIAAITAVFQVLNALLGVFRGVNLLADIAQSIGFTVIATAVWVYHGWVLRGDGRREKVDRDSDLQNKRQGQEIAQQQLLAQWADFPVAVVDDGDGSFGRLALDALKQGLPYLTLLPIGLTTEAAAALSVEFTADISAHLDRAKVIVTTWPIIAAGGPLAGHSAPKVVLPVNTPDIQWVGVAPIDRQNTQLIQAVKQLLDTHSSSSQPAQAQPQPEVQVVSSQLTIVPAPSLS